MADIKKDCSDCAHSKLSGKELRCSFITGDVSQRRNVCSKFTDSSTTKLCEDCEHYQFGAFSRWNDHGKCKLTGERKKDDDVACWHFSD